MKPLHILSELEKLFPDAQSELRNWETPFQFLVCIILSAQNTDTGVNRVTQKLFNLYPDAKSFSEVGEEELSKHLRSINFFRNKTKHIIGMAKIVCEKYGGEPPKDEGLLMKLPGVGKKTANVFLNDLYQANQGIAVDTHVARVSQRLGLTKNTDPDKIASDLEKIYPQGVWWKVNRYFVLYGRYYCKARLTKTKCIFREHCSYCKDLPVDR